MAMKLKFKNQEFQEAATAAVCDVFNGQPYHDPNKYTVDPGVKKEVSSLGVTEAQSLPGLEVLTQTTMDFQDEPDVGYKNAEIELLPADLQKNLHEVQDRQNLEHSKGGALGDRALPELEVEMETGTGKTFVYIKTIFELNKRYGWSKFIIIVPGIAIREGVKKSLDIMADKFQNDYGKVAKTYVYNSAHPQDVLDFSTNADIQVLVMNVQAFNARGKDARRIYMELDEFASRKPIDMIAANRPILILDEPQKMEGKATNEMLPLFHPLMILRYSATHKTIRNLVYRLDAIDAFEQKLVKKIEPVCIDVTNRAGVYAYVYCAEIRPGKDGPEALLEFQVQRKTGKIVNETKVVRMNDDLKELSKGVDAYQGRYRVIGLNAKDGYGILEFENGLTLIPGQVTGDVSEKELRRIQIREAIKAHLDKETQLFTQGVKVLTLFFIDKVANYRVYADDNEGSSGEYAVMFEEEYTRAINERLSALEGVGIDPALKKYWEGIAAAKTHAGYFAEDKKHRLVDSKDGKESESDTSAYDLILKNKEQLLSLSEPVRFIFSHSALREGWDNPNVFVMCPLKKPDSGNDVARRQEVGRGLRLCVDQNGERQDDPTTVHDVNILTVVANEEFSTYVNGLQKEIMEACARRPVLADASFFKGKVLKAEVEVKKTVVENGQKVEKTVKETIKHQISETEAKAINKWLYKNDFVDDNDNILPAWREARDAGTIPDFPPTLESLKPFAEEVMTLVDSVRDPNAAKKFIQPNRPKPLTTNKNFAKDEFKELWKRINHKAAYTVEFSSDELIRKAIEALDRQIDIPKLTYTVKKATQTAGNAFAAGAHESHKVDEHYTDTGVKYDLIGKVAEGTVLTRKTVRAILAGMQKFRFEQFKNNPEKFIAEVIRIINEQKATMIVEHIQYHILEDTYSSDIFTKNQMILPAHMAPIRDDGKPLQKHIYDYIMTDSTVERNFAKDLDNSSEVVVYAKLPGGFTIPTPVGSYNPDWAIAFQEGKVKHMYFVAETKGTLEEMKLKGIEKAKIECAGKFFRALGTKGVQYHVTYRKVATYTDLMNMANSESSD